MSEAARNLMAGFDEIDLAEIAADAQEALGRARNQLAALHQGELPPDADEAVALTPAQWLWRWNRATPEQRLERIAQIQEEAEAARRCHLMQHEREIQERQAEILRLQRHMERPDGGVE
jgi:hypothetical protein